MIAEDFTVMSQGIDLLPALLPAEIVEDQPIEAPDSSTGQGSPYVVIVYNDDYHTFDGIPTAFSITRFKNGDMTSQRFLYKAAYNVPLPPDAFNIDAAAAKVKK